MSRYTEVSLYYACLLPGCRSVLVLDGNMKDQREVCYAKDAGFVQFSGLPGAVKTGCVASPAFMSRYCPQHKSQACTLLNVDDVDEDLGTSSGPTLRSRQSKQYPGEPVAEMLLAKKTTRKRTYYQVLIAVFVMHVYTYMQVNDVIHVYTHVCM